MASHCVQYDPQIGQGLSVSSDHFKEVALFDYRHRIPFFPWRHGPESGLFTGYTELSTALYGAERLLQRQCGAWFPISI